MIDPERMGIRLIPLVPEFISTQNESIQEESGYPKKIAYLLGALRHRWALKFDEGTNEETKEVLKAGRRQGEVYVYRKAGMRRGTIKLAEGILSNTREGELFTDDADFKETTRHVVTHPTLIPRFRGRTPGIYYAADFRGAPQYQRTPPRHMRRPNRSILTPSDLLLYILLF